MGNISRRFAGSLVTFALLAVCGAAASGVEAVPDVNEAVSLVPVEYRHRLVQQLSLAEEKRPQWLAAIAKAKPEHREAVAFLLTNMPARDLKDLTADSLLRNVELAYEARAATPWASAVPQELFFNEVLPYANLNERRDDWRGDFYKRFMPLVKDCKSASEACQVLNREVFKTFKVSYHATKRHKPDQSPYESAEIGYASCSGLSILLADACRAVGAPARVAGTPLWADGSGNHTWVEVWDKQWFFVGAAEPGPLNQTWFGGLAAKSKPGDAAHGIYAASFRQTGVAFPLVWNPSNKDYPAVDVTRYYAGRRKLTVTVAAPEGKAATGKVQVRSGDELVAQDAGEKVAFDLPAGAAYTVDVAAAAGRTQAKVPVELPDDADRTVTVRLTPSTTQPAVP